MERQGDKVLLPSQLEDAGMKMLQLGSGGKKMQAFLISLQTVSPTVVHINHR